MKTSTLSAAVVAIGSLCASASATTVDLQYLAMGANEIVNITVSPGYTGLAYVGQIQIAATNSSDAGFTNGNYLMYCADVYQDSSPNVNPYYVTALQFIPTSAPMGAAKASAIQDIYAVAAGAQYGANASLACGFQLAIWEIVTDFGGPMSLNTGGFQATGQSAAADAFCTWLLGWAGTGVGANTQLIGLASQEYQDYITEGTLIPAPGAMALLGLSGLVGSRRRRA